MLRDETRSRELRDYLSVLRRRRLTVVLTMVVVVASALVASLFRERIYEGRARILLKPDQSVFLTFPTARVDPAAVDTEVQLLRSAPVQAAAREKLGVTPDVSVAAVGSTALIEVRARARKAEAAAAQSNGYVETYIEYRRRQAIEGLENSNRELQARVDTLQNAIDGLSLRLARLPPCVEGETPLECSQRESLQQDRDALLTQQVPLKARIDQLQVDTAVKSGNLEFVAPASAPRSPVQPRPVRDGLLALGFGLVFGIALALLFDYLDDSVKNKEDLERVAPDLPVLGTIPWDSLRRKSRSDTRIVSQVEPSSPSAEAYRTVRTSIQMSGIERPLRTLVVTSPRPGEGKTTAIANLAVVLGRAGTRVVVVDCDLRRPRVHDFFGLSNAIGLTSVILDDVPLAAALQDVEGEERLQVLTSGPVPRNPSELLSSKRMSDVLSALKEDALVLLDSPPALPVTDAVILSSKADGTLVLVRGGWTRGRELAGVADRLRQVGAPVLGAVLNGMDQVAAYPHYHYSYPDETSRGAKRRPWAKKGSEESLTG